MYKRLKPRNLNIVLAVTCVIGLQVFHIDAGYAQANNDSGTQGLTAVAQSPREWLPPSEAARMEFDFGSASAWLNAEGKWQVEGWVQHNGLLCATYQLGVRFGEGNPGCTNVVWLTEPRFATQRRQCNNARLFHNGIEFTPEIADQFDRITCGERRVRCSGRCGANSPATPDPQLLR